MTAQTSYTLINPQTKDVAFRILSFDDDSCFKECELLNCYTIVLITKGKGKLKADFSEYEFGENTLMCFSVYQPFVIEQEAAIEGIVIKFHPDFFCIHKHQNEVSCNGVLFNNVYEPPLIALDANEMSELLSVAEQLKTAAQKQELAQYELMIAYLKIFLINASRMRVNKVPGYELHNDQEPFILKNLQDAIEEHYKKERSPSAYAKLLNMSTKALNRLSKNHFNRTLSSLIAERIIIEAKRELYLTSKPVKMIAYELGFDDEFYFSRFFKTNANVSPQNFRTAVGFARAEK